MPEHAWSELKDGDPLHASQVQALADGAPQAAASMAVGLGAAGRFVLCSDNEAGSADASNAVEAKGNELRIANVAVLTCAGFLARLPGHKAFSRPESGETCLNVYAPHHAEGHDAPRARWESEKATDPRGVTVAEWSAASNRWIVHPLPFVLGAQAQVFELYQSLIGAAEKLAARLLHAPQQCCERLRAGTQPALLPLVRALQLMPPGELATLVGTVQPALHVLGFELLGWLTAGKGNATAGVDSAWQRQLPWADAERRGPSARLTQRLSEHARTGTALVEQLTALVRAVEDLQHKVDGTTRDDAIASVGSYDPTPYAGQGSLFDLAAFEGTIHLRCELTGQGLPPALLWGNSAPGSRPALREAYPTPVSPPQATAPRPSEQSGTTYEAMLGPIQVTEGPLLAVVVDPPVLFRLFLLASDT